MNRCADFPRSQYDAQFLQYEIDMAAGRRLHLAPRVYGLDRELVIRSPIQIGGEGIGATVLRAMVPMRSVLRLEARAHVRDIVCDGQGAADHGVTFCGSAWSKLEDVGAINTRSDGYLLDAQGNNAGMTFRQCGASVCGVAWIDPALGPALDHFMVEPWRRTVQPLTADADVHGNVAIDGLDLTTLGLRQGDVIAIGFDAVTKRWTWRGLVYDVRGADSALCVALGQQPMSGPCVILRGDGYREERSGDNGKQRIEGGLFRSCAAHAMSLCALYGPLVEGQVIDYCAGGGVRVGLVGFEGVLSPVLRSQYFETCGGPKYTLCSGLELSIESPLDVGDTAPDVAYLSGPQAVRGIYRGSGGLTPLGPNGVQCCLPRPA